MSREEPVSHPGDEAVYIPANGFSLAATLTKPKVTAAGRRGAVVLVASPGPQGREHMSYGVPIFGQLAGKLADAGVLVVRYDARGVGQSGGRTESAGLPEYAEDALAVVSWLRRRPDVDAERVVVAGYADGGPVALTAASRSKDVKGVILLAAPGRSGRDVTLEQQERALSAASVTGANRQEKIALQTRIMDAVVTGKGWDTLPKTLRADVDSIWFRTWLQFSPADSFKRVNQPVFIGHGGLDQEMPSTHAEALATLARARKVPPQHTTLTVLPRLNHLFLPAQSGAVDEYPSLSEREIGTDLVAPLTEWLRTIGRPR
jgi:pimeloyl-ACP methyl ester carboxylesterase